MMQPATADPYNQQAMRSEEMGEGMPMPEAANDAQPFAQPQQSFTPYPVERLIRMFTSWQTAKDMEIAEAFRATQYYHGKQWTPEEIKVMKDRAQPVTTYNKIRKAIEGMVGVVEDMQGDPQALGRKLANKEGADIATQALRFVEDSTEFQSIKLECARDGFRTGIGCIYITLKKKRGQLWHEKQYIDPSKFFYDPRSERLDFTDARFMGVHGWYDDDSLIEKFPKAKDKIESLIGSGDVAAESGGSYAGTLQQGAKEHTWVDGLRRRIYVVEIWYKKDGFWAYAFLCGNTVLDQGVSPFWDFDNEESLCPYLPWSCYMDDRLDRYGMVRDMFSPQDEVNKRRSKSLHLLSVRQTKGVKGSVDDIAKMKRELAKPDGHVEVNPNADFEILQTNDQLQGHFELLKEAKGEIEALGPNPNIIGRGNQDQSGIALQEQKAAAMREHGPVFKQFLHWKLRVYKFDWAICKQFWTDERMIRITDAQGDQQHIPVNTPMQPGQPLPPPQQPQQMMGHNGGPPMGNPTQPNGPPMAISQDPHTGQKIINAIGEVDVDIIIQEGPDLPNDEALIRQKLIEMAQAYGPQAVPFEAMLRISGLPMKEQRELTAMIQQAKQPDPMQQQMQLKAAQMQAEKLQAEIDKIKADTKAQEAAALANIAKSEQVFSQTALTDLEPQFRQAEMMLEQHRHGLAQQTQDQSFEMAQQQNAQRQQQMQANQAMAGQRIEAQQRMASEKLAAAQQLQQQQQMAPGMGPQPDMPDVGPMQRPMGMPHKYQPDPELGMAG